MERAPEVLLSDMILAMEKIRRYTAGLDKAQFLQDDKTYDAVIRNLEIIGEAARRLPPDFTGRYPEIPWRQMGGMRNRIVHDSMWVDLEIVWNVIEFSLPDLDRRLREL